MPASRAKFAHIVRVTHRDEVEAPLTDWIQEAYEISETLRAGRVMKRKASSSKRKRRSAKQRPAKRK
jgi:hypothetical protein